VKVSEVDLQVPTPITHHVHHVETDVAARLPLHGESRTMVLALVEHGPEGHRTVQDFSNYAAPQRFVALHLEGGVGYVLAGNSVRLDAEGAVNSRAIGNLSGSLSLELWAFATLGDVSSSDGHCLAVAELPRLAGQHRLSAIGADAAFTAPPEGRWQLALLLREWTQAHGYVTRDRRVFAALYEQAPARVEAVIEAPVAVAAAPVAVVAASAPVVAEPVAVVAAAPVAAAPVAVVAAAPVASAPVASAPVAEAPVAVAAAPVAIAADVSVPAPASSASPVSTKAPEHLRLVTPVVEVPQPAKRLVSIQTAPVEELAKVKGLNPKLAKEIVKARPFTSLNDLVKVRGIGEKTLQGLKSLLTL
jgi:DNA uptake protein ComE-like DNA-binding protein